MKSILVGVDGTDRGRQALKWASRYAAREGASLTLLSVVDPAIEKAAGIDGAAVESSVEATLAEARQLVAERYPGTEVRTELVRGKVIDCLVEAAAAHDMIVMGSHHGASVGETVGGAKGLRVSVSVDVPTVVVPADWEWDFQGDGIVVAVGPDDSSENAVEFGVRESLADGVPVDLVSAWGLPALLSRPAEVMGGGLGPVGEQFKHNLDVRVAQLKEQHPDLEISCHAVEGPSPTRVLLEYSKNKKLLVLGTHSRSALGRTLFGSVTHSVLLNLSVPTVVVPQR